jgi:hypothetical protein
MDPRIRTQGAERGRSYIAMKHGGGSLESSNALRTAERETPSFTQVQGPPGEVKPYNNSEIVIHFLLNKVPNFGPR